MNEYERCVLQTLLQAALQPPTLAERLTQSLTGRVRRMLEVAQAAPDSPLGALLARIQTVAREAIMHTLERSATAQQYARVETLLRSHGSQATTASEIRLLPLAIKDSVARRLAQENTVTVAAEGALAGLTASLCELIPGLQTLTIPTILADMATSIYLLAQNAVRIGYSYGYSLDVPEELPHFLAAMAPHTTDAALLEAKWMAHAALRDSSSRLAASLAHHTSIRLLSAENPAVGRLLDAVVARIALRLTEREWGLFIPVAGAVIQGAVNAGFARAGSAQAVQYFQRLHLVERYGEDYLSRYFQDTSSEKAG